MLRGFVVNFSYSSLATVGTVAQNEAPDPNNNGPTSIKVATLFLKVLDSLRVATLIHKGAKINWGGDPNP